MNQKEYTAITATLDNETILKRASQVAGYEVGDALNDNLDSVKLREQFGLTIEHNHKSVWAFNETVSASTPNLSRYCSAISARRATVIAVAAMWRKPS